MCKVSKVYLGVHFLNVIAGRDVFHANKEVKEQTCNHEIKKTESNIGAKGSPGMPAEQRSGEEPVQPRAGKPGQKMYFQ